MLETGDVLRYLRTPILMLSSRVAVEGRVGVGSGDPGFPVGSGEGVSG
jgi:hypothetical protein